MERRRFLSTLGILPSHPSFGGPVLSAVLPELAHGAGAIGLKITALEAYIIPVNARGDWVFVRLRAGSSLSGLGEASQSTRPSAEIRRELQEQFAFLEGRSPFEVEAFRLKVLARVRSGGRFAATAASALEQAMWDLVGKALGAPVHALLGGRVRARLPVYANVNRATVRRTPEEFAANARQALAEGFRAVKAAPFDDVPPLTAPEGEIARVIELGIRRTEAIRKAIGPDVDLLIDCHSHFDRKRAIEVARQLEPLNLYWYEEPVRPENLEDTQLIKQAIKQKMAGGEALYGREAFEPLCRTRALDIIMPDVKHCGGLLEGKKIAALAEVHGVQVSPHNPAGPVSTAASLQLCATLPNFGILEYAWGEVPWRSELIDPPEAFSRGELEVPDRPGLGIELNDMAIQKRSQ